MRIMSALLLVGALCFGKSVSAQENCRDMTVAECMQHISRIVQQFDEEFSAVLSQMAKSELPVGTIVTSALPPDQFLSDSNPQYDPEKWVVADGKSLPSNSIYQRISGSTVAPDMGQYRDSKVILDVISGVAENGQNVGQLRTPRFAAAEWVIHFGLRDITGRRCNNDLEQDADQFQIIPESGTLAAHGRTHNFKHNCWGPWNPGSTNFLGIGSVPNTLHYYVKIN